MKYNFNCKYLLPFFAIMTLSACGGSSTDEPKANVPPTVSVAGPSSVIEGESVTLSATATDSDGTIASVSWAQLSGPTVTLNNASLPQVTFVAPQVQGSGTVILAVTAKDNSGASATAQISIGINDEEVKTLSRAIQKMEEVGARPVLDRSDDVAGPDVNQDGVRDDIAAFIAGLPATDQQKTYLMTYAVGIQKETTYTPGSLADPDQHARDMALATVCVLSSFEDLEQAVLYHKQVQNYTANTKERARRLFEYSQSRNGTVVRLPSKDNCTTGQ